MVPTIPGVSTALGNQVIGQRMMRAMSVVPSSLGPELPIDDDEVHAWTAVFDDYLSKGGCLATVAGPPQDARRGRGVRQGCPA
jgi:hypothetical protein